MTDPRFAGALAGSLIVLALTLGPTAPAHIVEAALKARAERAFSRSAELKGIRQSMDDKHWTSEGVQIVDLGREGSPRAGKAKLLYLETYEREVADCTQNRTIAAMLDLVIEGGESADAKAVRVVGLKALSPLEKNQLPSGDDPSDGG